MRKLPKTQNDEFIYCSTQLMNSIEIVDEESMSDFTTLSLNLLKACKKGADEGDLNQLLFLHRKYEAINMKKLLNY
jgi:hypothetical protein